jgi:hypothetical protein
MPSGRAAAQTPATVTKTAPLSVDDVSWLFPAPTKADDFKNIISLGDLTAPNPLDPTKRDSVWSESTFQQFLAIAGGDAAQVAGANAKIGLPTEARTKSNWFVAGIRIDPGAPGLSQDVRNAFGQSPQIRLIVQPVIRGANGAPVVLDIAAHLIFDFNAAQPDPPPQAGCFPRAKPDMDEFRKILAEIAALRTNLSNGQFGGTKIVTAGLPLGVHPGLANTAAVSSVSQEMKAFLQRHLADRHLNAMALMALPIGAPEPWMFVSMVKLPPGALSAMPNGGFVPVNGPTLDAQQFTELLRFGGATQPFGGAVEPIPHTNNRNTITCVSGALFQNAGPAIADRRGSSTADLRATPSPSTDTIRDILDLIADPGRSHFFNTDCVSCHTETRRAMTLLKMTSFNGLDSSVLPQGDWVLRNFGWAIPTRPSTVPASTATRRVANETAEVVKFINNLLLTE